MARVQEGRKVTRYSKDDITRATEWLDELKIRPGETIYTMVTHVAPSGVSRWIRVFVMRDNAPRDISWPVSRVLGYPVNTRNHEGLDVGGCGMDMGYHVVYSLSRAIFRKGFRCIQPRDESKRTRYNACPSNDHVNARVWSRMPGKHSDPGYALNHKWL
jgi:hypothetical protein